jgi:hypothetical protein
VKFTDEEIANLMLRFEALIGHLELRSVTTYEKDLKKALERIFIAFMDSEDMADMARRREVARAIVKEMKPVYGNLGENILTDMAAIAGITNDLMNYAYQGSFVEKALSFNARTTLFGFELGDLLKGNEEDAVKQFKRVIADGIARGKNKTEVYREFKKLGEKKMKHVSQVLVGDAMKKAREMSQEETYKQLEKQGLVKGVEWLATLEANTCICAGEQVNLSDGSSKPIEKISPNDSIITHLGNEAKVKAKMDMGEKEVIEVIFDDGRRIKGTKDHRVWTGEKWVELGDIEGIKEERIKEYA